MDAVAELQRAGVDDRAASVSVVRSQNQSATTQAAPSYRPADAPPKVTQSLRSKAKVPLSVTSPVMLPVEPLPI